MRAAAALHSYWFMLSAERLSLDGRQTKHELLGLPRSKRNISGLGLCTASATTTYQIPHLFELESQIEIMNRWVYTPTEDKYSYAPLDTSQQTIRLLRVEEDDWGFFQGHLEHFEIEHAPAFRALSYKWGTSTYWWGAKKAKHDICVDGRTLSVSAHLYTFFEVYNTRHVGEWIWIDQVY
jgi:hypothetical protein